MKQLPTVFLFLFVTICILFAAETDSPPKPLTPILIDIPGDGGTNILLQWRHFETVPGVKYEILRSENNGTFESITPLQLKTITFEDQNTPENDVSNWGYYMLLVEQEEDLPIIKVFRYTDENRDSLISNGAEKILHVETGVPFPSELAKLPNVFALGEFYRVIPDEEIARRPQSKTIAKELFYPLDLDIPSLGDIGIMLEPLDEELDFVGKGNRIISAGEDDMTRILKYGKQIVSIVTEKARYTMKYDMKQYLDRSSEHSKIFADTHYCYKIRLFQIDKPVKRLFADSDTSGITPANEPPPPPDRILALYDASRREVVMNIGYASGFASFYDKTTYSIWRTSPDDSACESGSEVLKIGASWRKAKISDVDSNSAFYIVVEDSSGQTGRSQLIQMQPVQFGDISLPPNLRICDRENDDGKKIAVRWNPPTLSVGYSVEDIAPQTKIEDISSKNIYSVPTDNGPVLMQLDDIDETPDGAQKVLSILYSIPGAKKILKISYQMWVNSSDDALYSEFELNGNRKTDTDNKGEIKFDDIEEGKYNLTGWMIRRTGGKFDNPEASIDMEVDVTSIHSVGIESSPYVYYIYRGTESDDLTTFKLAGTIGADSREFDDIFGKDEEIQPNYYIIQASGPDGSLIQSDVMGPITRKSNWFNTSRTVIFFGVVIFVAIALFYTYHAKRGKQFYIRPIAGIVHIEEALGRATELGKPIVFVPGIGGVSDIATISAYTILGRVARKSAEYQNRLFVPCYYPMVMIVCQETVKNAFMDAGRPDLYKEEDVYYIAAQQFAFAAAIAGLMIREKSAANFFMGTFAAESLILAESGSTTGAIQVAGTIDMTQLPFFITACDYTLIGEELFAASAYLSNDPMQKGSLKAQDILKSLEMALIVIGTFAATAGIWWFTNVFQALGGE